jgi:hypothetical protein
MPGSRDMHSITRAWFVRKLQLVANYSSLILETIC